MTLYLAGLSIDLSAKHSRLCVYALYSRRGAYCGVWYPRTIRDDREESGSAREAPRWDLAGAAPARFHWGCAGGRGRGRPPALLFGTVEAVVGDPGSGGSTARR